MPTKLSLEYSPPSRLRSGSAAAPQIHSDALSATVVLNRRRMTPLRDSINKGAQIVDQLGRRSGPSAACSKLCRPLPDWVGNSIGRVSGIGVPLVTGVLLACHPRATLDGSAPDPSASATGTAQSPLSLGDTAVLPMLRVRFISQRECGKPAAASNRSATRTWAGELEVTNTSTSRVPANPFYATLKDDQGYNYTTSLADCGTLMPSQLLGPSESVRGFVPFELPAAVDTATLTYRPILEAKPPSSVPSAAQFRVNF